MKPLNLTEPEIYSLLKPRLNKPFVFLETARCDKDNSASFLFKDFSKIITFNYQDNVGSFFEKAQNCLEQNHWLCGFFSYEFGYFLEPALYHLRKKNNFPLAWLASCKEPLKLTDHQPVLNLAAKNGRKNFRIGNIKPNINYHRYKKAIGRIKTYLENGTNYQTNFTFKIKFNFKGDVLGFYLALRRAQPTSYLALINTGEHFIVSMSPELFFKRKSNKITVKPMKGTCPRGFDLPGDKKNERQLITDKKIIAENLMIVDLLRNDLGRVSKKVWVPELFSAEKYKTLYQMTSTVSARLKKNAGMQEIFSSLFPSGSVTGAPKIKTMKIIKKLEKEPRNIYTGAIGYITPDENACFSVAIRTIILSLGKGEMGIGGGIVYDSSAKKEYDEALLKAKFLIGAGDNFSLIESMLWSEETGYYLLGLHLKRLKASCGYFSINPDFGTLKKELADLGRKLKTSGKRFKIRVLLDFNGSFKVEKSFLPSVFAPVKIRISPAATDPQDNFLYHKTTRRALYDKEYRAAQKAGFFETIFFNKYGALTEGCISNVFILKKGTLYTPPVKCGLLPGVLRGQLLINGRARERILRRDDLRSAEKIYIGNSVRGLIEAKLAC